MKKFVFILILIIAGNLSAQVEVTDRLSARMQTLNPLEYVKVLVLLRDRVDIASLDSYLYMTRANPRQRAQTVITTLQEKAASTQGPLLQFISAQKDAGKVKEVMPFWITNMIMIEANADVLHQLTKRSDIELMDIDALLELDKPVFEAPASPYSESSEIGLRVINAHKLWELGITGVGSLVMSHDTGADPNHPALSSKWRANNGAPVSHAWFDPINNTTNPSNCDSHGNHTLGIMCGSAGSDTIGVAPGAQWIAAKTICTSPHTSYSIAAFQWAMNPDSNIATTSDMPIGINCSWHDPSQVSTQCSTSIYVSVLPAIEAAGIAVVFSAGNSGPGASTLTAPKNLNIDSVLVFAVGAVDGNNSSLPIASFSSRGPSLCGGSGTLLIKPEVSAPGVSVRSSLLGSSYGNLSGTSMAAPHVVGALALLKQVAPNLTGHQLKSILLTTCTDLGTPGEDNTYGRGVIDVYRAFQNLGLFPLSPFNLNTPGVTTITTYPASNQNVSFNWDTSATGANYKWIFGNPTVPPRKITMQTSTNSLTMNLGDLDAVLDGLGVAQGDSLVGQWDVWAFRISPQDSMKAGNGPRTITLKRGVPPLTAFNLASPPNNSTVQTTPTDYTIFNPTWTRSGQGVEYNWMFATPDFSNPSNIKMIYEAANNGYDTSAAIRKSQLDSALMQLGLGASDSISGQWRVYGYSASDSLASSQTYNITLRRLPISTVTIGTGTAMEAYPLDRFYNYMRWQGLWLSSELNFTGNILKIRFYQNNSVSDGMQNVKIFMKETSETTLPTGTWDTTGTTMVYSGTITSLSSPGWLEINLTTPFYHSSGNNLMIAAGRDFQQYITTYPQFAYTSTSPNYRSRRNRSDTQYPTSLTQSYNRANIQVEYTTIVGIEGNTITSIPNVYSLSQNYPNPFNPSTKINYGIPKDGLVNIKIYDLLGKEIATLVNENKQAGYYDLDFNASHLASGVYFYRIKVNDFVATKRMMLIK